MNRYYTQLFLIIFVFITVGCGVNTKEKQNCVPKVKFVSTKSVMMHLIKVLDPKFGFSDLKIKDDERFLCISTPNVLGCDDSYGKLNVTELPEETILRLTGIAKRIEPFGFSTAFKTDLVYLQGIVNDTTVWLPLFELNLFAEYISESEVNKNSCEVLEITDSTFTNTLKCFD